METKVGIFTVKLWSVWFKLLKVTYIPLVLQRVTEQIKGFSINLLINLTILKSVD